MREGDKLPADSLVLSTKNIWDFIKSQKDLNLPAHKVGGGHQPITAAWRLSPESCPGDSDTTRIASAGLQQHTARVPRPAARPAAAVLPAAVQSQISADTCAHLQCINMGVSCVCLMPVLQIMVANIRCAEIMKDQLHNFSQDQAWAVLKQESSERLVRDFGATAGRLLDSCLKG